jgi:flagellum-specific peptidoglycan hydrolase FlgJ
MPQVNAQHTPTRADPNRPVTAIPGKTAPNPRPVITPTPTPAPVEATKPKIAPAPPPRISTTGVNAYYNDKGTQAKINDAVERNILNQFYQSTYHFRFFITGDQDAYEAAGQPNDMSSFYNGFDSIKQITLAESGVTGYNIKEVHLTVAGAETPSSRGVPAIGISMTIVEANGISFLDALLDSATILNLKNYTEAVYYLELYFLGYDESGKPVSSESLPGGTPGRWIYSVMVNDIAVKLNEGGATYTLTMTDVSSKLMVDDYDIVRAPVPFYVVGDTVGKLYKNYIAALNKAVTKRYGGPLIVYEDIITHPVEFPHPPGAAGVDPADFKMVAVDKDKQSNTNWQPTSKDGPYTVSVTPGYPIMDFILDAIHHTVEGQQIAFDNDKTPDRVDKTDSQVNSKLFRESVTWVVDPVVTNKAFDDDSNNYVQHITFHVRAHYNTPKLSKTQFKNAESSLVQNSMVVSMIENGMLKKRYDYIFTGLNTQVIDFDLAFNMTAKTILSAYDGAFMRFEAQHVGQRLGSPDSYKQADPTTKISQFQTGKASAGTAASSNQIATGRTAKTKTEVRRPDTESFIEDALNASSQFTVPQSTWQGNATARENSPLGMFPDNKGIGTSVFGALLAQNQGQSIYKNSGNLTIVGDPYWIGQSNLERAVTITSKSSAAAPILPNYASFSPRLYLTFRYPVQVNDDFKPNFKTCGIFNGIFQVTKCENHFTDGVFKQVLTILKDDLIDPKLWSATDVPKTADPAAASNPALAQPSTQPPSGTEPGHSPIPGVDFKPGDKDSFVAAMAPLARQQAAATGLAPELILAQAGLETNWGKSAPQNNYFGIKGPGASLQTTEVVNGSTQTVNQTFAGYTSAAQSFQSYGDLITSKYAAARNSSGIVAQAQALQRAGYATDQDYASKLIENANKVHLPS